MSVVVVLAVIGTVLVVWVRHRRQRARLLSGTDAARPVFSVEPPSRRLGPRKRERL